MRSVKLCDANILINAHRAENTGHQFYHRWLKNLLSGQETFLYCEWILSAFVRVVTHPRIFRTPTPLGQALRFAEEVRRQPVAVAIMPGTRHWEVFDHLCRRTAATGNLIPDAYLAALAIEAGAEWITADEGFAAFEPDLTWRLLRP